MEPQFVEAKWPPLSAKVSFVRIDAADVKFTGDNQRAWISFFKAPRIIYVDSTEKRASRASALRADET